MRRIVFLLVPGVHLLDLAGPAQVFSTAAHIGLGYRLHYYADKADVPSAQGLPLVASTVWPDLTSKDIVLVPGWRAGLAAGSLSAQATARLAAHHATGGLSRACAGAGVSERALNRLFGSSIGMTPLRYQQLLRLERAEHLIGHGATVESAARAVGFTDARMLRRLRARS